MLLLQNQCHHDSTWKASFWLVWHNFRVAHFTTTFFLDFLHKSNFCYCFVSRALILTNLNMLCNSVNKSVLRVRTAITVFVTVWKFMLLIETTFWECWKQFLNEDQGLENNFLLPQAEFLVTWGKNFLLPEAEFLAASGWVSCHLGTEFLVTWSKIS